MQNKFKIIALVILILGLLLLIANLVWGKTARMFKANQLFAKSQTDKAKAVYEDLAVDLPKSPYILHNIGLSFYKQGDNEKATEYFKNSLKEFESLKQNQVRKKESLHLDYYHLGSSLFQSAAKNGQGQQGQQGQSAGNLYQEALDNFQKAIENNPTDLDAKYNYELTKLRFQTANQQQSSSQNQDKNGNKNDKKDQNQNSDEKNANQKNSNQEQQQQKDQNQMSKEEVESLLKMNENNDQYQTPVIINKSQAPEKDW